MTPTGPVAAARAEIARCREFYVELAASASTEWLLGVLDDADVVLDRHRSRLAVGTTTRVCDYCDLTRWPCPDARTVLNRYAPQP